MVRSYGLYANAHRGKVKKASLASRIIASRLPEPAAFASADRFLVLRAALDSASGPEYPRWRGQNGNSSRFRTSPRLRSEKEILILHNTLSPVERVPEIAF
jgi:hypothetical protein